MTVPHPPAEELREAPLTRPQSSEALRERQLRDELEWFLRRDWAVLLADRRIVSTFLRRATRAILLLEELDEQAHRPIDRTSDTAAVEAVPDAAPSPLPANLPEPAAEPEPAAVAQSPLSVDQVELYEFGKPRVSEHPLYNLPDRVVLRLLLP